MPSFVLIHSPLASPATWAPVADELQRAGAVAVVPALDNDEQPFWQHHARQVASTIAEAQPPGPVIFVAHSGAGPALPAIAAASPVHAAGYVFVDAALPADGGSRLDMFSAEEEADFRRRAVDGVLPPWGDEWPDEIWRRLVPDEARRASFRAGLRPTPLGVYEEPLPIHAGWPDAPCAYLKFSPFYDDLTDRARGRGWRVRELPGMHLHMLAEPAAVADALLAFAHT
ncbi:MAG: alpha/beta fold hydrolase [Dehalococcoidia bacterium]